jgi:predicted O-linked N-acetylglucosamine transferase (SPINDLY family)
LESIIEVPQTRQVSLAEALQIAVAQHRGGQVASAEALYRQILQVDPGQVDALHLLGVIYCQQQRWQEAEPLLREALRRDPNSSAFQNSWGRFQLLTGNQEEALKALRRALELSPQNPEAHYNLAEAELAAKNFDAAVQRYEQTLMIRPVYPEARFGLAQAIRQRDGWAAAIPHYQLAVAQAPDSPVTHRFLAMALQLSNHLSEALDVYLQITKRWPQEVDAWIGQAAIHFVHGRLPAAIAAYEKALELAPDKTEALDGLVEVRRRACDWREDMAALEASLVERLDQAMQSGSRPGMRIFTALYTPFSAQQQLYIARSNAQDAKPADDRPRWTEAARREGRIRVGYMIADVRDHPNAHNTLLLYGLHDAARFELFTYSWGLDDNSAYRKKIIADSEHFIEMRGWSDEAMAQRIAADGIQILVDLMGHTGDNRIAVLARRPAPIQINYLGFPATSGADYIDYIIGDSWVTAQSAAEHFAEKIIQMPWSYQINSHRELSLEPCGDRTALGLPAEGFIFCCFNNSYKIDQEIFARWMRILTEVPNSVLWLYRTSDLVDQHLRQAAIRLGVAPERLIFAPFLPRQQHIQRLQAADLFLDTPRYNAHTTASDALWAGVPVLTVPGETFASRVAASLLHAAGLDACILPSWEDYESTAISWATNPDPLRALRQQLQEDPRSLPIFDTPRLVRDLEQRYLAIYEHWRAGGTPRAWWSAANGGIKEGV